MSGYTVDDFVEDYSGEWGGHADDMLRRDAQKLVQAERERCIRAFEKAYLWRRHETWADIYDHAMELLEHRSEDPKEKGE